MIDLRVELKNLDKEILEFSIYGSFDLSNYNLMPYLPPVSHDKFIWDDRLSFFNNYILVKLRSYKFHIR